MLLNISGVENALNKCSKATSSKNALSAEASLLSEVYGQMIHEKNDEIDFADYKARGLFSELHLAALEKYYEFES